MEFTDRREPQTIGGKVIKAIFTEFGTLNVFVVAFKVLPAGCFSAVTKYAAQQLFRIHIIYP